MSRINHIIRFHWVKILLFIIIILYTSVFSWLSIQRQSAFFSGYDLGNMDQTMWNTIHGHFFTLTNGEGNLLRFSIHADIILAIISPIYYIWDNVNLLLIFQSFIISLGVIPVYLLSQKLLKDKFISFVIVAIYILHPSLEWANIYDFHSITIAIPVIISAYYLAYVKQYKLFYLLVFIALLCREDVGLIISSMGVLIFFALKNKRLGLITTILGAIWFLLDLGVLIPFFSAGHNTWSLAFYQLQSGESINQPSNLGSTFTTLISQAGQLLISGYAFKYYLLILKPFAFLPILGLPFILPAIPTILLNVLSSKAFMTSSILHYESGLIPFMTIASIYALVLVNFLLVKINITKKYSKNIMTVLGVLLLIYILRDNYANSPLPISPNCYCIMYQVTPNDIKFANVLAKIPATATVDSSPEIRPHVSHRLFAYSFPYGLNNSDYFAIITRNQMIANTSPKIYELDLIQKLERSKQYKIIYNHPPYYLFQKL